MKLSIRYKILVVVSVLLLLAVGFYTLLASSIFREEKTALLYDLNHSLAINTAAQLDSSLRRVADQVKLYAISRIVADKSRMRLSSRYLQDSGVMAAELYRKKEDGFSEFKLPAEVPATQIDSDRLRPYLEEASTDQFAFWNQIVEEQLPRYFLASRFDIELNDHTETYVAVAEIESRSFFESIQAGGLFEMFVFRKNGDLLFRTDHGKLLPPTPVANHPILNHTANVTGSSSGVQSFDFNGQHWYGAVAPVGISGLSVLSQASHAEVAAALTTLVRRSLLFGLIVVTVTFIASVLFSKRLTRGLKVLASGAERIGRGDLKSTIELSTGDEVEKVAASFNAMVEALRASREAIEEYNRELEQKVALRTKQLQETNAAIKDVQEKLLRTTQLAAVGEVAGRTAHELLNPLTAILSRLERSRLVVEPSATATATHSPARQLTDILTAWETDFRKGGMPELVRSLAEPSPIAPQQTLFEEDLENLKKLATFWQQQSETLETDLTFVQDQAQRIHRIIDRMREYVRSSVKSEVHCHEAILEAVQTMADYMAKQGVQLDRELTAQQDTALLNRDELVQILSNLLRNALQAIAQKKASGKIKVSTNHAGRVLTIDVLDNGIGIPRDKQRYLFEQGFTTKAPSEGTGLGLAICRRYARAFGGEVELLFSEPDGRGTCFRITVPLHEAGIKAAS